MKKETIELARYKGHIQGYGRMIYPTENSKETLERLMDWANKKGNILVYKHIIWNREENFDLYSEKYKTMGMELSYCDNAYYMDIYYQEN